VATQPAKSDEYAENRVGVGSMTTRHRCVTLLLPSVLEARLLQDAIQSSRRKVVVANPAAVTSPGLVGCLNYWSLPRVRTCHRRPHVGVRPELHLTVRLAIASEHTGDGEPSRMGQMPTPILNEREFTFATLYSIARRAFDSARAAPIVACAPSTRSSLRSTTADFSCELARYVETPT
jgi:hypothetical protein